MNTVIATRRRSRLWLILLPLLALGLLAAGALFIAVAFGWAGIGMNDWQLVVDGEPVVVDAVSGWHALAAGLGIVVALLMVLLVVPIALLFGLALPVIACVLLAGVAIAAVLGVGLLLAAPLLVPLGLLLWWALRSRRKPESGRIAS